MQAGAFTRRATFQPVMGTHLELQITASDEQEARAAEETALAEATRLEAAFTVFDPASELCRWRSGEMAEPSVELADLLDLAASWQVGSAGAFNPLTGVLTDRWRQAEADGAVPADDELRSLAASIGDPRFTTDGGSVTRRADCGSVDLNAIAKGHVVDRVARRVLADHDVVRLVVNAGGDLVHRGADLVRVAVEDPLRPYDNAPPLTRIEVRNAAVATSGRARRWFDVDGQRWSRVLDPRTGRPVDHTASATAIAPDAPTADVLATVASVLEPNEVLDLVARLEAAGTSTAVLVIGRDGTSHRSPRWHDHEVADRS